MRGRDRAVSHEVQGSAGILQTEDAAISLVCVGDIATSVDSLVRRGYSVGVPDQLLNGEQQSLRTALPMFKAQSRLIVMPVARYPEISKFNGRLSLIFPIAVGLTNLKSGHLEI